MTGSTTLPDGLADALGQVLASARREWRRDYELALAQRDALIAGLRADLVEHKQRLDTIVADRMATLRDGRDGQPGEVGQAGDRGDKGEQGNPGPQGERGAAGDVGPRGEPGDAGSPGATGAPGPAGPQGEPGTDGAAGAAGPAGEHGERGDRGDPGPQGERGLPGEAGERGEPGLAGERGYAGAVGERGDPGIAGPIGEKGDPGDSIIGPAGPRGEKGYPGESIVGERGEAGEKGEKGDRGDRGDPGIQGEKGERGAEGPAGTFSAPRAWARGVHYESSLVTHDGSTWCARQDTAEEPPHDDWTLVAACGRDAPVGEVFGLYDLAKAYHKYDLVAFNGAEWRARRDDPGPLPGDGWAMSARQGKPGPKGERGDPGIQGPVGKAGQTVKITEWIRDGYRALPIMSDGSIGPPLDVREFFELYHSEAR